MPNMPCKCGHVIGFGEIPNPNEWNMISDVEYDRFSGKIDAEELYRSMKSLLICANCKRLWIYWKGFEHSPVSYILEGPGDS
jgi:hypothetical protein